MSLSNGLLNLTNWLGNVIMPTLAGLFAARAREAGARSAGEGSAVPSPFEGAEARGVNHAATPQAFLGRTAAGRASPASLCLVQSRRCGFAGGRNRSTACRSSSRIASFSEKNFMLFWRRALTRPTAFRNAR